MRSVLLVLFGVLVLASAWWWQQRSLPDCCLQEVEPVVIERPEPEPESKQEKPVSVVLDLSLPADVVSDAPLPLEGESRYGVEKWFAPKEEPESPISFKSKLLMKDGVELQPDMGNYQEAIDGAEMGIEYKTR